MIVTGSTVYKHKTIIGLYLLSYISEGGLVEVYPT